MARLTSEHSNFKRKIIKLESKERPRKWDGKLTYSVLTDGREWYWEFIRRASNDERMWKAFQKVERDTEWTKLMEDFLKKWGKDLECETIADFDNPIRIDMIWRIKEENRVAIEHENKGDRSDEYCDQEIDKLINYTDAKLRILITYVKNEEFPSRVRRLANKIKKRLAQRAGNFELLLLVGPYCIDDPALFVCYRFCPAFKRTRVLPKFFE